MPAIKAAISSNFWHPSTLPITPCMNTRSQQRALHLPLTPRYTSLRHDHPARQRAMRLLQTPFARPAGHLPALRCPTQRCAYFHGWALPSRRKRRRLPLPLVRSTLRHPAVRAATARRALVAAHRAMPPVPALPRFSARHLPSRAAAPFARARRLPGCRLRPSGRRADRLVDRAGAAVDTCGFSLALAAPIHAARSPAQPPPTL